VVSLEELAEAEVVAVTAQVPEQEVAQAAERELAQARELLAVAHWNRTRSSLDSRYHHNP
jgi:hypothetical protein